MSSKPAKLRIVQPDGASPDAGRLDAEAAALLADIAAFDIEAARLRVQEIDARATGLRTSTTVFPGVVPGAVFPEVRLAATAGLPEFQPIAAPLAERDAGSAGGLLGELKGEVADTRRRAGDASRYIDSVRVGLDQRLRSVFDYLHDLTTQLNYLKPAVARRYFFLDSDDAFRNLAWFEGFADFRTVAERDGGHIERVTLGYTLKGSGERTLERMGGGVERLRQVLFDLGLKFECRERRNGQRELEQGSFTVADEIRVQVVWRADVENQVVVIESRNLERLGYASCSVSPDAIGPALLDEFGRLLLGRENGFRRFVLR